MIKRIIVSAILGILVFTGKGQTLDDLEGMKEDSTMLELIQFSGIIVSGDSLFPVPYVNVYDKASHRGTVSDYYGYFSFVAKKLDTIVFSSVGYKKSYFIIPDTLTTNRYSMIHMMLEDTIELAPQTIYPWPSREDFARAFMELDIPDDDIRRARERISAERLAYMASHLESEGSSTYKWDMQQYQSRLYYNGQAPPIHLLNPVAWAQFVNAWREGKFKIE